MSRLPKPTRVDQIELDLIYNTSPNGVAKKFDLNRWHANFKRAYDYATKEDILNFDKQPHSVSQLLYELYCKEFLQGADKSFLKHIGYSTKHKSLTISLFDDDEVKTIVIRRAINGDGSVIKWKTFGSKSFIASKLQNLDEVVFLASGMSELIAFEVMGVDYVLLQSDSTAKAIENNKQFEGLKEALDGRVMAIFIDNDVSGKSIVSPLREAFESTQIIAIDFEELLGRELPKGYDFRDFCNEIKDIDVIEKRLSTYLKELVK